MHDGTEQRPVSSARQRALLAALLVEPNRVVSRSRLADLIWNAAPPYAATATLHSYAMRLRRALGPTAAERIHTRSPGYLAEVRDGELDTEEFARLRADARRHAEAAQWIHARAACVAALDLWRGNPLTDVELPAVWSEQVHRWQELRLQTVELRIEADLRLGAHSAVVAELDGLVEEHPYRESLVCQLMLALYRGGRRSEALSVYQRVRALLADELGIEPGPDLRSLHQRLLTGDPGLDDDVVTAARTEATAAGAVGAPGSGRAEQHRPPAQLPAATSDFCGREDEVALLAKLLDPDDDAPRVVAVTGTGGVGKTALALQVANRLRPLFPDGQLFASLAGAASDPGSAADVQRGFLAALGVKTETLPADPDHLTGTFRSTTSGRRLLLLLDDAPDSRMVRDLLPTGPGSAVIVTSRASLAGLDGAATVELRGLDLEESRVLLARLAGQARVAAEPEAVDAVSRACAGLPLAVRIVGTRLASRPAWPVRHLADRLADERGRLDALTSGDLDVRACFQVGYEQLDADADPLRWPPATALCLLSLWRGPDLPLDAAAALLDGPAAGVERVLERLVDCHMLESPAASRYRLHDLLRVFAAEKAQSRLDAGTRAAALERLVSWYARAVNAADRAATPQRRRLELDLTGRGAEVEFASRGQGLAWIDREHGNVVAAAAHALDLGVLPRAWQLAVAAWGPLTVRRRWEPLLAVHRHGLQAARAAADRLAEAWVLNGIGCALVEMGRLDEAREALEPALALRRAIGDLPGEAMTLNNLGVLAWRHEDLPRAVRHMEASLVLQRRVGDRAGQAMALSNLGQLVHLVGGPEKALDYLTEAMEIRIEVGDPRGAGMTGHGIGVEHLREGRLDEAVAWFERALGSSGAADDFHTQAMIRLDLGRALAAAGRGRAAREHLVEARRLFHTFGDQRAAEAESLLRER